MAASTGKHRRHPVAARPQPALRAGALAAGVVAGTFGIADAVPGGGATLPPLVHRDGIALVDNGTSYAADAPAPAAAPTFDDGLHYLLDDLLGAGTKTLPELIAPDPTLTMGELLGDSSNGATTVDTSTGLHDMLYLLGLNNIDVGDVMDALNLSPTKTVDQVLQQMNLADVNLDQLLTPLGIPSTQTLYGLMDRMSLLNQTLIDGIRKFGPIGDPNTQTVEEALQSIGLGGFYDPWFTGSSLLKIGLGYLCHGVKGTVEDAIECVHTQYGNADTAHPNVNLKGTDTIGYLLTHVYQLQTNTGDADFSKPLGDYTIGQALGFNNTTTIQGVFDKLMINTDVHAGQWAGGIDPTTGAPAGAPVVSTVSGTVPENSGQHGALTLAPADDDVGPGEAPTQALGTSNWGNVLTWMGMPPNESLADLLSSFWVNDVQLGHYTLGDMLDGLIVNPGALSTPGVEDSTTVDAFLSAIGFNTMTLDQLIGLN